MNSKLVFFLFVLALISKIEGKLSEYSMVSSDIEQQEGEDIYILEEAPTDKELADSNEELVELEIGDSDLMETDDMCYAHDRPINSPPPATRCQTKRIVRQPKRSPCGCREENYGDDEFVGCDPVKKCRRLPSPYRTPVYVYRRPVIKSSPRTFYLKRRFTEASSGKTKPTVGSPFETGNVFDENLESVDEAIPVHEELVEEKPINEEVPAENEKILNSKSKAKKQPKPKKAKKLEKPKSTKQK
ncbi:hypothetical protein CHUAL_000687 [Chamberlinius hualienensis]